MITIIDDAIAFVRAHPEIFFRATRPSGEACAYQLVAEVLVQGANDVVVRRNGNWWFVFSTTDWFGAMDIDWLFSRLSPLPQLAQNASRVEVVIAAYCGSVITISPSGERRTIVGSAPDESVWTFMSETGGRLLAFSFGE